MMDVTSELQEIISVFSKKIQAIPAHEFDAKPTINKWSKKEVLGHLIDSAQNNLRRFVVGQYDHEPNIVYNQDFWVKANNYQSMADADLIKLWVLVNERIIAILRNLNLNIE